MLSSLEYVPRFSMCNCVTLAVPECYTAHAMTMDFFLKMVVPGTRIPVPYTDMWPSGYVRVYKIPKRIDTFLFSPFNESFHPNYVFEDDVRYTLGPHEDLPPLKKIAREIPRLSANDYIREMHMLRDKVDRLWNTPLKLLVLYDNTRATPQEKKRVRIYDELARRAVPDWPVIQVDDPKSNKPRWCHYTNVGHQRLIARIVEEEAHGKLLPKTSQ